MKKAWIVIFLWLLMTPVIAYPFLTATEVSASPGKLVWSVVETPSNEGKVIVSPSEINVLSIGSDGKTFYVSDIPNSKLYRSIDGGISWTEIQGRLPPGAQRVWDIAIAPDNPNIVAVVTNNRTQVYVSQDGGDNWVKTDNIPGLGITLIADIAISPPYISSFGKTYDIAIGTRFPDGVSNGDVWIMQLGGLASWQAQGIPIKDVTTVRFSPNYVIDRTILVVALEALPGSQIYLCLGIRDVNTNTTNWNIISGYPVPIFSVPGGVSAESQIITSDLALPSDYLSTELAQRRVYIGFDSNTLADDVYRVDDIRVIRLNASTGASLRITSLAYYGTCRTGNLIVGGTLADANLATAIICYTTNPEKDSPSWEVPLKLPTGGGGSGYANAQVAWSSDGSKAYCGTATTSITTSIAWANMNFPGPWSGDNLDESSFSVTEDGGKTWNQLSLIDTEISRLKDVAVSLGSKILYLASINTNFGFNGFDSIWRSSSDPLGKKWERVWCGITGDNILIRTNEKVESDTVIFADTVGGKVYCSFTKGQRWAVIVSGFVITDLTLESDEIFYLLEDNFVRRVTRMRDVWIMGDRFYTGLLSGHTITTPVQSPKDKNYVIVGDATEGKVAYSSDGGRSFSQTKAVPTPAKIHVATDDKFEVNKIIYAATDSLTGKIYRWTIDQSISWEELQPPSNAFYGLVQKAGVLYGAWWDGTNTGIDRSLYPRAKLPLFSEWDTLIAELPSGVIFTGEPNSIKVSTDEGNCLWAIDNRPYIWASRQGCLWSYIDTLVQAGPWATTPAPGEILPVDPVTGRAAEIVFRWRRLLDVSQYELWIAIDENFSSLLRQEIVIPSDVLAPTWTLPSGSLAAGKIYYWKVRAYRAYTGEIIRSPWSATIFFNVMAGSRVRAFYSGPILLAPANGATDISPSPAFSWVPVPEATEYEFVLAKDIAMTKIIVKVNVPTAAYKYKDKLDPGTTYFWQVRAIKPILSSPSPIGSFTVAKVDAVETPKTQEAVPMPFWAWVLISLLVLLLLLMVLVNFFVTDRRNWKID